jgi:hypothetical protein
MAMNVIAIGKRDCTPLEQDALHTIGFGIAHAGHQLHVPSTPGAPAFIAEGYRAAGKEPTIHTAGMGSIAGDTIAVLDSALIAKLDQRMPDWEKKDWIVLSDETTLLDWAGAMVAIFEETDRSVVSSEGVAA